MIIEEIYSAIDNIAISCKNLIRDSNNFIVDRWLTYMTSKITSSIKYDNGYTRVITSGGESKIKLFYMISYIKQNYAGKQATLSFDIINHTDKTMTIGHNWAAAGNDDIEAGFDGKYVFTGKV